MIIVQVEGNIAVGKSTFLNYVKNRMNNNNNNNKLKIKFIDEPLSKWMNVNSCNLFNLYYQNQNEYSELFQTHVFLTMLRNCLKENYKDNFDIIFMERSLYSSVYCFDKLLLNNHSVRPIFHDILTNALESFKDKILYPDIVIYFKIENNDIPSILQKRIRNRQRCEENVISDEYLIELNNVYDKVIHDYYINDNNIKKCYIIPITKYEQQEQCFDSIIDNILAIATKFM